MVAMGTEKLLEAVLQLSESERMAIVERLLESLPPGAEQKLDEEWEAELDRRFEEFETTGEGTFWEDLKNQE